MADIKRDALKILVVTKQGSISSDQHKTLVSDLQSAGYSVVGVQMSPQLARLFGGSAARHIWRTRLCVCVPALLGRSR